MTSLPHWSGDPLIDQDEHSPQTDERDIIASAHAGRDLYPALCRCGRMPPVLVEDGYSLFTAYDEHMRAEQTAARGPADTE
ncbi:hypothetical protein ACQP10_38385 (plasmid) [Streptosporangium sandarakinum]|uniref:hypothetical protein n=1 Tax=Streptosporangium sandarakinum TaxID=1260955 RepID=UPI003D8DAEB4